MCLDCSLSTLNSNKALVKVVPFVALAFILAYTVSKSRCRAYPSILPFYNDNRKLKVMICVMFYIETLHETLVYERKATESTE
jgi:hypothetical protein